ncbi:MarR family winged helix-turn-helix transcriptional regulator [Nitratireductor luteus]|uniref:MarR family winged helix-turn-helix transcriptional regulator n=1 Tax=Nitratireductor luteus TaxID=2976980 RepID=UPI002240B056|nr:MarR family transcriptional regulator [Nitratireductor luteus]
MDHVDGILKQWNRERPDLDVGPMGLIGRISRIYGYLMREMSETFAKHGLNRASFDVLATLRRSGPPYALSPGDLLAATMVTSGTMTNRIDQLEKAGLVARAHNPDDRRSMRISLTQKGREVIDAAVTDHVATQARLTAMLSEEERKALDGMLGRYLSRIEGEG